MNNHDMRESLSFDDVLLAPKYSDIKSRKEVETSSELDDKFKFDLPIISSPMDTVTETVMASTMAAAGGLGIIHRYNTIEQQAVLLAEVTGPRAAAVGMTGDFKERTMYLYNTCNLDIVCVDVAHGHHSMMEKCIKSLKDTFSDDLHVMAGNVATLEAFNALASWGADSVRVGIGGGSICSTRLVSGHGIPTLQSVLDCAQTTYKTRIIADGGIKTSGDIVKAYAAGADFVMVGSLLAGTDDTPGEIFKSAEGKRYKVYRGMASSAAQNAWRGKSSSPEGITTTVPYKGSTVDTLADLHGGIRSGFSYSGCRNLKEFQAKSTFIRQTLAGQSESFTHILTKNKQ
jgi:IMP dehydrogenase